MASLVSVDTLFAIGLVLVFLGEAEVGEERVEEEGLAENVMRELGVALPDILEHSRYPRYVQNGLEVFLVSEDESQKVLSLDIVVLGHYQQQSLVFSDLLDRVHYILQILYRQGLEVVII